MTADESGYQTSNDTRHLPDGARGRAAADATGPGATGRPDLAAGDGAMPSWESDCACPGPCLRDHQLD